LHGKHLAFHNLGPEIIKNVKTSNSIFTIGQNSFEQQVLALPKLVVQNYFDRFIGMVLSMEFLISREHSYHCNSKIDT
jgi:hypothetical protein